MQQIPITATPNQSLSFQSDGNQYDITIRSCNNAPLNVDSAVMAFDIAINNTIVVQGVRATSGLPFYVMANNSQQQLIYSGYPLIPYPYLENGNFVVLTQNYEYPDWRQFGVTQFLIYASQSEIEAIINAAGT